MPPPTRSIGGGNKSAHAEGTSIMSSNAPTLIAAEILNAVHCPVLKNII
jgi:hypothetical protein